MSAASDAAKLKESFPDGGISITDFRKETTVTVKLEALHDVLAHCRSGLAYVMLLDISSVDHFGSDPRFEVVYELATLNDSNHLRVKCQVGEDEEVPTATDIWAGADWHEREVWDMMGIRFAGHPDLRRILMWEGYPYFPLRKDFPLAGRPTDMPDVASTDVAPLEGGPFVTSSGETDIARREPRAHVVQ
ncbi:MAG: NADH-quinone oxidoreductase subunit C [Luteolibacter sp.]|jgi:NADH-quinone oxidoreductase subunit C